MVTGLSRPPSKPHEPGVSLFRYTDHLTTMTCPLTWRWAALSFLVRIEPFISKKKEQIREYAIRYRSRALIERLACAVEIFI